MKRHYIFKMNRTISINSYNLDTAWIGAQLKSRKITTEKFAVWAYCDLVISNG